LLEVAFVFGGRGEKSIDSTSSNSRVEKPQSSRARNRTTSRRVGIGSSSIYNIKMLKNVKKYTNIQRKYIKLYKTTKYKFIITITEIYLLGEYKEYLVLPEL
jgi:hypothetical protein